MNNRLTDHLAFLILKNSERRNVCLKGVSCSKRSHNAVWPDVVHEKIRADQGLDESVVTSAQVFGQMDIAGDVGTNAIQLPAQLSRRRTGNLRRADRQPLPYVLFSFE